MERLRKYATILTLILLSGYIVCLFADDFDNTAFAQTEMQIGAEFDNDDFDDDGTYDFCISRPPTSQYTTYTLI